MLIQGVVIPADQTEPLRKVEFRQGDLSYMQSVVGGLVQALDIERPDATLWSNDEGKLIGLEMNRRATALWWVHDKRFRNYDVLVGNVLLTGTPDSEGNTASAPDELVTLLLSDPTIFKVEFESRDGWVPVAQRFDNWYDAYASALRIAERHRIEGDVKISPA